MERMPEPQPTSITTHREDTVSLVEGMQGKDMRAQTDLILNVRFQVFNSLFVGERAKIVMKHLPMDLQSEHATGRSVRGVRTRKRARGASERDERGEGAYVE